MNSDDADDDTKTSPDVDMEQPMDMASVNDFPAEHWQEDTDTTIHPPPPVAEPTPSAAPPTSLVADSTPLMADPAPLVADPTPVVVDPTPVVADPTPLVAEPTIHDRVVDLVARVSAMELAERGTIARIDAMEREFDSRISSMRAEFSAVQLSFSGTVDVVHGLVTLVEKLRRECTQTNPSFLPPVMAPVVGSSATAMGRRYLTGVFDASVAPNANSVGVAQASASCSFSRPDGQASTFTSGQPSSEPALAGPSSAPAVNSHFSLSSPASATHSLP